MFNRPKPSIHNVTAASVILRQQKLERNPSFKILGSDLDWQWVNRAPCLRDVHWAKARCVTPGEDEMGTPFNRYTILSNGEIGISAHIYLPYQVYFFEENLGSMYMVRKHNPNKDKKSLAELVEMKEGILDLSSPYRPVFLSIASVTTMNFDVDNPYTVDTRMGVKKILIPRSIVKENKVQSSQLVYLVDDNIICRAFSTGPDKFELQMMFNMGNNFKEARYLPVYTEPDNCSGKAIGVKLIPMFPVRAGTITTHGLWKEVCPELVEPCEVKGQNDLRSIHFN